MYEESKIRWHNLASQLNKQIIEQETGVSDKNNNRRSEIQIKNRFKCLVYKNKGTKESMKEMKIQKSTVQEMIDNLKSQLNKIENLELEMNSKMSNVQQPDQDELIDSD